jgi:hypothetical protein
MVWCYMDLVTIQPWKFIAMGGVSDSLIHTSMRPVSGLTDNSNPTLYVRSPRDPDDREIVYSFPDDDPYFGEFSTFIDAVESPTKENISLIFSSFEDAVSTYDLTWRIREASEASTKELHSKAAPSLGSTASTEAPSSLESSTTATAGPTAKSDDSDKDGKGIIGNLKESVEKLGLGGN